MPFLSLIVLVIVAIVAIIVVAIGFIIGMSLWSGLCVLTIRAVRPAGKRWPWVLLSIPLFIPAYLICIGFLIWALLINATPSDEFAYEYAFDVDMSPTVVVHQSDLDGWGDWEDLSLYFSAKPSDIQQITRRGLVLQSSAGNPTAGFIETPYGRVSTAGKEVYQGGSPDQRFSTIDDATLIYDPATEEAWYLYEGID